ncbi:Perforin 1 (pore forming protein) [Pristimantis euphronides]
MEPKLRLFFWWLLLLHHQRSSMSFRFPRYGCRPGTAEECKDAKFVPGHTLLGEGIDIVTMETTGSFLIDLQEVGEKCSVCMNPHINNVLQKLPKALVDWRPEASCSRNVLSIMARSQISVANEATSVVQNDWKVGLNLDIKAKVKLAVGGSHSKMAKYADNKIRTDKYNFMSHKFECAFYSFRLGINASLTPHFEKDLEDLPDSYNKSTKAEYRRLISNFGTHYISRVKVGGRTQEVTAVRTCEVAMNGLEMDEVKDCLRVEAEVGIFKTSASISSKVEYCKRMLRKAGFRGDFHQAFSERIWEVIGGNTTFNLLSTSKTTDVFEKWIESLKTHPSLVSFSLEAIHNLVRTKGPKKESLRLAISDYVNEKALALKCSCPDCSCTCPASRYTSSACCPTHRGAAKLHVTIKDATGLKGDFWTQTDAYVKFRFDFANRRTPTIWNRNSPTWNIQYNLGVVELSPIKKYTIEVWDQDHKYDDLLGKCERVLTSGDTWQTCHLKRGRVTFFLRVTCADHLKGSHCLDYNAVPPRV